MHDSRAERVRHDGAHASVARCLGALDEQDHLDEGVHGVHGAGKRLEVCHAPGKRHCDNGQREQGKRPPVRLAHAQVERQPAPQPQHDRGRKQGAQHARHVDDVSGCDVGQCDGTHNACYKAHGTCRQGTAPVVVRKASVNLGVLARNVGEHGLVEVDPARGHREGRCAQRQENQGHEVGGHGHGADVQGEVDKRTQAGSQDKQQVAALVIAGRKRPLPQKRHARASQTLQDSRTNNQVDGYLRVYVHGSDEGETTCDHRRGRKLGHHAGRQRGGAIGARQAGDVRAYRSCGLRGVKRQRHRDGLELKR